MTGWLALTPEQRKATIDQAEQRSGIRAKAIEKDWWVTLTLKVLFRTTYARHIVFKGGTSLSKGWKLIARFSEDVDIALAPEAFGMTYMENPSKSHIAKLKREGCRFTSTVLKEALEQQFAALGIQAVLIEANPVPDTMPDLDPQVIFVVYPSLYDKVNYIPDYVKIEVSVRSLQMPHTMVSIQSLLSDIHPLPVYGETPFPVESVLPHKTFLEKTFLLHEEFGKPDFAKIRAERMSRHLYDLVKMMATDVLKEALADRVLYDHLVQHRRWYSRISWVNYDSLGRTTISIVPPVEVLEAYRADYAIMQEQMIYEESVPFDELMERIMFLQKRFREI
jgi:hypothetical protein